MTKSGLKSSGRRQVWRWGTGGGAQGAGDCQGEGVGTGSSAHGWCSWGQNSPCGYSHTGNGQGQCGRRHPGADMESNSRDSLWVRNMVIRSHVAGQGPAEPQPAPDGEEGASDIHASSSSVPCPWTPRSTKGPRWSLVLPWPGPALGPTHTGSPGEVLFLLPPSPPPPKRNRGRLQTPGCEHEGNNR